MLCNSDFLQLMTGAGVLFFHDGREEDTPLLLYTFKNLNPYVEFPKHRERSPP